METEFMVKTSELVRLLIVKSSWVINVYDSGARKTGSFLVDARIPKCEISMT